MTNTPKELRTAPSARELLITCFGPRPQGYCIKTNTELLIKVQGGLGKAEPHPLMPHCHCLVPRLRSPKFLGLLGLPLCQIRSASEWPVGILSPGHCGKIWGDGSQAG